MSRKRKLFTSISVVVVVAALGVFGTFAAFTATTTNTGNTISAGTVKIDQHAGYTTLYNTTNKKPGEATTGCVRVTYSGSLAAAVKLYVNAAPTNGNNFTLTVERGSGITAPAANMNCTGFVSGSSLFTGDLDTFATTYGTGQPGKAGGTAWATSDAVDYRFTITPKDDTTPNSRATDTKTVPAHTFTWEAQNN